MTAPVHVAPRPRLGRVLQQQGALIALVVLVVFGALRYGEQFATGFNIQSLLADDAKYALVALGMTFVIMTGGIDLSVGSVAALGGVVAAQLSGAGLLPAMLAALGVGAAVGLANGVLVARYGLAPFLVTLATLLVARGLALQLADARSAVADPASGFQDFGRWSLLGIPVSFWIVLVLFAAGALALHATDFGRHVLATGGNEDAARLMGLPVDRTKVAVYVLSGTLAGAAGAFLGAQTGSVDAAAGQGWELTAIAAVVVGGTLLTGGVGSVFGTLVGVLLLQLIFNLIVFENGRGVIEISSYWESVIRGAFLLAVVLLQVRLTRRRAAPT
ncbi:ABC transporter permease [Pseudonocardia humida]|uniref:ABC transporter permease n=1 Tax=Pseudonocardia humida TaxID=2800819 RepID=A0ABT1A801_9PSEU|nr:ABC transporter permease [Pseudonocardia humida]MCO1659028.1 ABC transporter permease [Pseudonocardia humida]